MGKFGIDDEFWVFEIQTDFLPKYHRCITYGSPDTCIEVRVDNTTDTIFDIQCIYMRNILSEPIFQMPDIRSNPEMVARDTPYCKESDDSHRLPCIINVIRNEMQLIFSENSFDACCYYADGRVEYYYDGDMNLLHIKVVDLTEEEFGFLKSCGSNGAYFHWT